MPLAMTTPGELVMVSEIRAGRGLQKRLADMGLIPGIQVRVINAQAPGPVLINLRESRIALGQSIAQKIAVKKV
jgi:ferrous iron transport protein A